ncbi:MAG: DNA helicase RecQ [Phycisphaerales bacterium]|nr:MAG: DNA helicase RecQ [Phycisphaerales bacterium]
MVRQIWGFDRLRPLQEEAIRAELDRRDSVVVLPTGGGKSLCYQLPPAVSNETDVVVSPLISLMKDQVDGLRACGYPCATLHTGVGPNEKEQVLRNMLLGEYRLLFVSPERLVSPGFIAMLKRVGIRRFAVDEAHCISHWGHDFRQQYRELFLLKEHFPEASVHAYTATATPRVRDDIATQLRLRDPQLLVGDFDRPNLTYRIVPRFDLHAQIRDIVARHANEAVIIYCLSRKDSEEAADALRSHGIEARAYHAGMSPDERRKTQDAFAAESLNVVTATVAFGMGIDRSNVRCVIHATMPKSIEHYQQETGRAGRDGLEAECILLYSAADFLRWRSLAQMSSEPGADAEQVRAAQERLLNEMSRFCTKVGCRHRALKEYFGEEYDRPNCGACDVCLGEAEGIEDATETAQKILSCVARVHGAFGVGHVCDILTGADTEMIRRRAHHRLSTYGILRDMPRKHVINLVYQLIDQRLLERTEGDRPVVQLNDASWEVMRGKRAVQLLRPKRSRVRKTRAEKDSWIDVDKGLFEHLRDVRRQIAQERSVPAFVIFSDAALRDMARKKPTTPADFLAVQGVGSKKLEDLGDAFIASIKSYCSEHGHEGNSRL